MRQNTDVLRAIQGLLGIGPEDSAVIVLSGNRADGSNKSPESNLAKRERFGCRLSSGQYAGETYPSYSEAAAFAKAYRESTGYAVTIGIWTRGWDTWHGIEFLKGAAHEIPAMLQEQGERVSKQPNQGVSK